jgi:hypothetical protein
MKSQPLNDMQALQMVDVCLRAMFANFIQRSIEKKPEAADTLRDVAGRVLDGSIKLAFTVEVASFEPWCKLICHAAQEGEPAVKIFDATLVDLPPGGTGTVQ